MKTRPPKEPQKAPWKATVAKSKAAARRNTLELHLGTKIPSVNIRNDGPPHIAPPTAKSLPDARRRSHRQNDHLQHVARRLLRSVLRHQLRNEVLVQRRCHAVQVRRKRAERGRFKRSAAVSAALTTPAMKSPGNPGTSPATSVSEAKSWSFRRTSPVLKGPQSLYFAYMIRPVRTLSVLSRATPAE